jgi:tetratricopeptide (TPR) repeat protein
MISATTKWRDRQLLGVAMMPSVEQINALWSLVGAKSADGRRVRRRLAAGAALAMLMNGLLTAIGLGVVVVLFVAAVFLVVCTVTAVHALPAYWPGVRSRSRAISAFALRQLASALAMARRLLTCARRRPSSIIAWLRDRGPRRAKLFTDHAFEAWRQLVIASERTVTRIRVALEHMQHQRPTRGTHLIDCHRDATQLNAAGTQQRRNGRPADAVELHRRALEIFQKLPDQRDVALTQNNLALALSHLGKDGDAIALFEEAAATLRDLGEREHEGRIIANLGLAHRRQGRHEQSKNVLQVALAKLTPASTAYKTVEAELRRAS